MSEQQQNLPEVTVSPEQRRLIDTAREMLAFPSTQTREWIERRPTTRREKVAVVLGKLTGQDRRPIFSPDNPFTDRLSETPKTVHTTRTKRIDWDRWAHAEGSWYISETNTTDVATGVTTEQLSIYRETMQPTGHAVVTGYDERPQVDESHELLNPIEGSEELARLQALLDVGFAWERQQPRPE